MRKVIISLILILFVMSGCARAGTQPAESETQTVEAASLTEPIMTEQTPETEVSQTETTVPEQTSAVRPDVPPEKKTVPPVTKIAPPETTTSPPVTTTAPVRKEGEYAFSVERFRLGCSAVDSHDPKAFILLSPQDVAAYFEEYDDVYYFSAVREMNPDHPRDFDLLAAKYDEAFFRTHQLILVQISEGSGSIDNTVKSVYRTSPQEITVQIDRRRPHIQTCDMAYWHYFIELETQDLRPTDLVQVERTDVYVPPSTVPAG